MTDRAELILGPMLRYLDATTATIWVETTTSCTVSALGAATRTFTIAGHHYALVIVDGLDPGTKYEYSVALDGSQVWPDPALDVPASTFTTYTDETPARVLVGSCRAAAPHETPFTLETGSHEHASGVDILWMHARRLMTADDVQWPNLLAFLGDQVYADNSSPEARRKTRELRTDQPNRPPDGIVADFEEYTWLYHESWGKPDERWLMSVVPSVMIFDDHDVIDDWNISASWVTDIRQQPWWQEHIVGAMMSYWVYQHLGNQSPAEIASDGLLDALIDADDGTPLLRAWAIDSEALTPVPGGYRFSFDRWIGDCHVIVMDCRNGRVLTDADRLMIGEEEWAWICDRAREPARDLVLASSVPVFVPDGLHHLESWNEAVCGGTWGPVAARAGEKIRRAIDLEDWSAFERSYSAMNVLLDELAASDKRSVILVAGDIHFSYVADLTSLPGGPGLFQIVSSPVRNALIPHERSVIRLAISRPGAAITGALAPPGQGNRPAPGLLDARRAVLLQQHGCAHLRRRRRPLGHGARQARPDRRPPDPRGRRQERSRRSPRASGGSRQPPTRLTPSEREGVLGPHPAGKTSGSTSEPRRAQ